MSVERELLVEALEWMEELNYVWLNSRISGDSIALELRADINKIEQLLAQPEQEPLSDDVICDGLPQTRVHDYEIRTFIKGVKFAEKMHGIGVDNE